MKTKKTLKRGKVHEPITHVESNKFLVVYLFNIRTSSIHCSIFFFSFQDNETMYLVAMLDPDTPSFTNPLCRHWVHFIFGNVKVSEVSYIKMDQGEY